MEIIERGRETRIFTGKSSYSKGDKRAGVKGEEEMSSSQGGSDAERVAEGGVKEAGVVTGEQDKNE
jgi:hypothetical protein